MEQAYHRKNATTTTSNLSHTNYPRNKRLTTTALSLHVGYVKKDYNKLHIIINTKNGKEYLKTFISY